MSHRKELRLFICKEEHKGFYLDDDPAKSLTNIEYTDFFEPHRDKDFPYMHLQKL